MGHAPLLGGSLPTTTWSPYHYIILMAWVCNCVAS